MIGTGRNRSLNRMNLNKRLYSSIGFYPLPEHPHLPESYSLCFIRVCPIEAFLLRYFFVSFIFTFHI